MLSDQDSGKHSCPFACCGCLASTFLQTVTERQLFFFSSCRSFSIASKWNVPLLTVTWLMRPLLCPQFAAWVDAVVFVFSLEDEISFQTVYNYFVRLSNCRNTAEVPMVLVGTQGAPLKYDQCIYCCYCVFVCFGTLYETYIHTYILFTAEWSSNVHIQNLFIIKIRCLHGSFMDFFIWMYLF